MIITSFMFYFFRVFFLSPAASAADLDREVVSMAHLLAKFRIEVIKSKWLKGAKKSAFFSTFFAKLKAC